MPISSSELPKDSIYLLHDKVHFHLIFQSGSGELFNGDNFEQIKRRYGCRVHYEMAFYFIS